jgi:hypothetical protein
MGQQNDKWTSSQSYAVDCIQTSTMAWCMVWTWHIMRNNLEVADKLLHGNDYRMLNVLGIFCNVTKGMHRLHRTFGGFGLFNLPVEQLISQVNLLLQHYHTSTNLSRKLDASLRYLQLQLGMPHNLLMLEYAKWGHLAPLSWAKMLWLSLHHFNVHQYGGLSKIWASAVRGSRPAVTPEIWFQTSHA